MRFIDRDQELEGLRATQRRAARQSQFTLVLGRRRMGKTTLVREFLRGVPRTLYFFVTRKRSEDLRAEFTDAERGEVHQVSREHFQIEAQEGRPFVVDRGSACGTIVEGRVLGGARQGGRAELHDQDVIIVGTSASPFVFKLRLG